MTGSGLDFCDGNSTSTTQLLLSFRFRFCLAVGVLKLLIFVTQEKVLEKFLARDRVARIKQDSPFDYKKCLLDTDFGAKSV
jgi:hypothetical protein